LLPSLPLPESLFRQAVGSSDMPETPEDKLSRSWGQYYLAKANHDEKNIPLYAMQCLEHIQQAV
jgi:hypothetical protein